MRLESNDIFVREGVTLKQLKNKIKMKLVVVMIFFYLVFAKLGAYLTSLVDACLESVRNYLINFNIDVETTFLGAFYAPLSNEFLKFGFKFILAIYLSFYVIKFLQNTYSKHFGHEKIK